MCVLSCTVSAWYCVNDFPHVTQVYGFTPVYVLSWILSSLDSTNDSSHISEVKGYTFVYVLPCSLRFLLEANIFTQ